MKCCQVAQDFVALCGLASSCKACKLPDCFIMLELTSCFAGGIVLKEGLGLDASKTPEDCKLQMVGLCVYVCTCVRGCCSGSLCIHSVQRPCVTLQALSGCRKGRVPFPASCTDAATRSEMDLSAQLSPPRNLHPSFHGYMYI